MTNADRIRAMTDEELRELFMGDTVCEERICKPPYCDGREDCYDCILDWLKQECSINI